METPTTIFETLFEKAQAFSKTSVELAKLKSVETASSMGTWFISKLSVVVTLSLFALVANVGIALWLGELFGKLYYGFFIVAAFYLLAGIVLHFFLYRWIKKPLGDLIISQALQ